MMLVGCSTAPTVIKQPILCPMANECGQISSKNEIRTNGELATAYQQSQQILELCLVEIQSLKDCIENFNQTAEPNEQQKEPQKEKTK